MKLPKYLFKYTEKGRLFIVNHPLSAHLMYKKRFFRNPKLVAMIYPSTRIHIVTDLKYCFNILLMLCFCVTFVAASVPAVISGPQSSEALETKSPEAFTGKNQISEREDKNVFRDSSPEISGTEFMSKSLIGELLAKGNNSSSKVDGKFTMNSLPKRQIGSKTKASQRLLNKLKIKSLNLKRDDTKLKDTQLKDMLKSNEKTVLDSDGSEYLYDDYTDPDSSQLEIKTESPPSSPDAEPVVYKDCPMFVNGELVGVRKHGAQWSDGDDQCELCACTDGEKRCYYHYCNGPKIIFITPPSAETPTTSDDNDNNINLLKPFVTNADPITTNTEQSNTEIENNNIVFSNSQRSSKIPGHISNHHTIPETMIENLGEIDRDDHESSGMQPWSLSDDEDTDYDYSYNSHGNHLNNIGNTDDHSNAKVGTANSRRFNPEDNTESRQNHVVFMEDYDSFDAFDPLETFETVNTNIGSHRDSSGKGSVVSANPSSYRSSGDDHADSEVRAETSTTDCDTDCGKSCPYGYKITPGTGCPTCKCLKCKPLVDCRVYCSAGYKADRHGCPVCSCSAASTAGGSSSNGVTSYNKHGGKVHHTLDGIQDTHRFSAGDAETRNPGRNSNNNSVVSKDPVHKNDVTYDRHDDDHHTGDDEDVVGLVTLPKHKNKNSVDPHNHFYDNAFNILKADELSILRDEDLGGVNSDGHHVDSSDNNLGPPYLPYDLTTVSSLDDDLYDVDYNVDYGNTGGEDDLTTTVDWQEVERQASAGGNTEHDAGTRHKQTKDCNHTAPEGCQDPAGGNHVVGSSWRKDACTLCRCYARGYAECTVTQCSPPMGNIIKCSPPPPGDCCPQCELRTDDVRPAAPRHHPSAPYPSLPSPSRGDHEDLNTVVLQSGSSDTVKEAVRSDLTSICLVVIGLIGSTSIVACLAIHHWRRYHSAKYEIAGNITAEEAQKLRPVKRSEDLSSSSVTCPLKPAKCV